MMKKIKKKILCLVMAALVLTASVSIKSALAYFTTYVIAAGEKTLAVGFTETQLKETIAGKNKIIAVSNTGNADCYVRVKVLITNDASTKVTITAKDKEAMNNNWIYEDGFYTYNKILQAKSETTELLIDVAVAEGYDKPFEIVVIQEYTPVLYDGNGTPYADWDGSDFIIEKR